MTWWRWPASMASTNFLGQDKGHFHVHPPFGDFAVLDETPNDLDPGTLNLIQSGIYQGDATLHCVFDALAL